MSGLASYLPVSTIGPATGIAQQQTTIKVIMRPKNAEILASSGENWNCTIEFAKKFVICRPPEPSSGWSQRLSVPLSRTRYTTAFPSGVNSSGPAARGSGSSNLSLGLIHRAKPAQLSSQVDPQRLLPRRSPAACRLEQALGWHCCLASLIPAQAGIRRLQSTLARSAALPSLRSTPIFRLAST